VNRSKYIALYGREACCPKKVENYSAQRKKRAEGGENQ